MSVHYWGIECIGCNQLHPVKLATADSAEEVPNVPRFMILCYSTKTELIYDRSELIKYVGPEEENFRPHPLFL